MILFITILITTLLICLVQSGLHKYVMHGLFWNLHEDHHVRDNHDSFLELNDSFFVFFAIISITAFALWSIFGWQISLGIGIGVFIYGVIYFIIHDLFIHQRIKIWRKTKNPYLLALRRAHKIHHKHLGKHDGECFGMLWVPMKYFKGKY